MTGDIGPAQKHFPAVLEMGAPEELRGLVRNWLREIAALELRARGAGKNAGLLSGWVRRLFRGRSLEEVREITFEIGMRGKYGLNVNDPSETHVLRALPGMAFSALELVCIMYARLAEDPAGSLSIIKHFYSAGVAAGGFPAPDHLQHIRAPAPGRLDLQALAAPLLGSLLGFKLLNLGVDTGPPLPERAASFFLRPRLCTFGEMTN